jgi:arylsulfatase A-like enzyme
MSIAGAGGCGKDAVTTEARRESVPAAPPPAAFRRLAAWAFSAWACQFVLLLLQQLDALVAYDTPRQIWHGAGTVLALAVPLALASAALAWSLGRLAGLALPRAAADLAAWTFLVVPTIASLLWQSARSAAAMLRHPDAYHAPAGAHLHAAAGLAIVLLIAAALWRPGLPRLLAGAARAGLAMRGPAAAALLLAVCGWAADPQTPWRTHLPPSPASAPAGSPDVYLITLDALAAADADVCGDGPATMPRLRGFASRATCFSRLYASSNFTTPGTSTIETGTLPWSHWAAQVGAQVAPALQDRTLARALHDGGYATSAFSANYLATPRHHGTHAAYDEESISPSTSIVNSLEALLSLPADPVAAQVILPLLPGEVDFLLLGQDSPVDPRRTYDRALRYLDRPAPRPRFMWVHTLPPHAPYLPPPGAKYTLLARGELERFDQFHVGNTRYAPAEQPLIDKHRLRYRETILGSDKDLGDFLDALDRRGLLDGALVIVSADHGESFEKGFLGHAGPELHDALLHIPLVVKLPRQHAGRRVDAVASQADIAPTVLDVLGLPPLPRAEGRSLKPALLGGTDAPAPAFAMSMEGQSRFSRLSRGRYAMIDGRYKLELSLDGGASALYDLEADPQESRDLSARQPAEAARMLAALRARLDAAETERAREFAP